MDYRFENKPLQVLVVSVTVASLVFLLTPLYEVHVIPNGENAEYESAYTLECYVFRSRIKNTDCPWLSGWNSCFQSLMDINTGICDSNKLIVGSENLEEYSVIIDASVVAILVLLALGFLASVLVAAPSSLKNSFLKTSAFFHFLSGIAAIIMVDHTFSVVDELDFTYENGIGQKPTPGPALYVLAALPMLCLVVDNFYEELL